MDIKKLVLISALLDELDAHLPDTHRDPSLIDDAQTMRMQIHLVSLFAVECAQRLSEGDSMSEAVVFALRGNQQTRPGMLN